MVYTFYSSHLAISPFFFSISSIRIILFLPPYIVSLDHYIFISPTSQFLMSSLLSSNFLLKISSPPPTPLCLVYSLPSVCYLFKPPCSTLQTFLAPTFSFPYPSPLPLYFTHCLLSLTDLLFLSCSLQLFLI